MEVDQLNGKGKKSVSATKYQNESFCKLLSEFEITLSAFGERIISVRFLFLPYYIIVVSWCLAD